MPNKYSSTVSRSPSKISRAPSNALVTQTTSLSPSMPRLSHANGAWVPIGKVAEFSPCYDRYCHDGRYYGGHWRHYEQEKWMSFDEIASLSKQQNFQSSIQSSRPQGYIEDITDKESLANEERKRKNLFQKQLEEAPEGNKLLDPNFGGEYDNSASVSKAGSTMSTGSQAQIAALQAKIQSLSQQNSVAGSSVSKSETVAMLKAKVRELSRLGSVAGSSVSKSETVARLQEQVRELSRPGSVAGSSVSKSETVARLQEQVRELSRPGSVAGSSVSKSSGMSKADTVAMLQAQIGQLSNSRSIAGGSTVSKSSGMSKADTVANLEREIQLLMQGSDAGSRVTSTKRKAPKGDLRQQALLNQQTLSNSNKSGLNEFDLDDNLSDLSLNSNSYPNKRQKVKVGNLEGTMEYIGDGKSTVSRGSRTSTIVKNENQIG